MSREHLLEALEQEVNKYADGTPLVDPDSHVAFYGRMSLGPRQRMATRGGGCCCASCPRNRIAWWRSLGASYPEAPLSEGSLPLADAPSLPAYREAARSASLAASGLRGAAETLPSWLTEPGAAGSMATNSIS